MSGIFGCFTINGQCLAKDRLTDMAQAINLQGYSITKTISDDVCCLGEAGIQSAARVLPSEKGAEVNIVVCGEIYNGDIEKEILTLHGEGKLDQLKNLNGSFAAAIYDKTTEKLTLINDRYGLIKEYYYQDDNSFCFAHKVRPLLSLVADKSLRKDAIIDFFLFGYLLGDKTFFEHIHQLPPASILEVSKDGLRIRKYWDYEYAENYDLRPQEDLVEELGVLWQRAVERRVKKDQTTIIPLSGGLDSRAILAAALRCTPKDKIITFTFGEPGSFDFEIGRMVAEKAGVRSVPLGVEKEDFEGQYNVSMDDVEGMIDATPYFAIEGYRGVREYGNKLYCGYMGDPIMGSHISPKMLNKKLNSEQDYSEARSIIFKKYRLNPSEDIGRIINPSYLNIDNDQHSLQSTCEIEQSSNGDVADYCAVWDYQQRQHKYVPFTVFRYDTEFEYVAPFLDNDLVDFMLTIPPNLRVGVTLYKSMLMKKYPELFGLPTKTNSGLKLNASKTALLLRRAILFSKVKTNRISTRLRKRKIFLDKNKNYIDYDDLLRRNREYKDYMRNMIEKVEEREYFNKEHIEGLWRLHMQGKKNYAMLFGLLVTFELFVERFMDA